MQDGSHIRSTGCTLRDIVRALYTEGGRRFVGIQGLKIDLEVFIYAVS